MFYTLTGKVPDDATERIDDDNLDSAKDYGISPELWSVIEKCMAVRAADRYSSVIELKEALKAVPIMPAPLVMPQDIGATIAINAIDTVTGQSNVVETVAVSQNYGNSVGETIAISNAQMDSTVVDSNNNESSRETLDGIIPLPEN